MKPNFTLKTAKDIFNIDSNVKVPVFTDRTELVPDIDPDYKFNPEITNAILVGFTHNKRVLLQGFHGTGKSTHIEQVAARLNWPCYRLNLDSYISRLELIGKDAIVIQDGKQITEFKDGIIPWAIKQPIALVLDEYDAARPDAMFALQRLLEGDQKFALIEQNKIINVHEHFRIFATANTIGQGDATGLYHGTQYINQGQLDRWNIVARLNYLDPKAESEIVLSKVKEMPKDKVKEMIKLANLTRQAFINGDIANIMSPRTVISWAQNYLIFGSLEDAFCYSFMNKCEEGERPAIAEMYQRIFGVELKESVLGLVV